MWFPILTGLMLAAIIVAGILSDVRRRGKLRRLGEQPSGCGLDASARSGRAHFDVRGNHAGGAYGYGHTDPGIGAPTTCSRIAPGLWPVLPPGNI